MSLLEIDGLTHSFGENVLYKIAGFTLNKGEHIGIVGQNGTGKSTLIKICTEQIIPDSGRIVWQPNTTVGYLDQYAEIDHSLTMKEFLKSAFSKLFDMERYCSYRMKKPFIEAHSVRIAELMKEHEHGILTTTTDKLLVDFVTSTSRRVSSEYLKQNYPSIYEEARKPSKNRKVKVTIQPL